MDATSAPSPADAVVVTGTGRASAVPDTTVLDLRLEGHGATVGEALTALARASQACHEAVPGVRTHGLGVHPRHDHHGRAAGHTAYQMVQVRTPDATAVGDLVHRLGEAVGDALGVEGLRQEILDTEDLHREARERAFADALHRAQGYAALAGRSLGVVRRVHEPGLVGPQPFGAHDARMAMSAGPVVDPAEHEVVAVVEVTWALES